MNAIFIFVATTYAMSAALSTVIGLTGGYHSPLIGLGYLTMFFPAAALLVVRLAKNEGPRIDWNLLGLKYLPLALFLMPAAMHVAMLSATAAFEGGLPWQEWLTPQADGLYHAPEPRGWGVMTAGELAVRIAINAIVGLVAVSILAFFEEVGWRAWLLPQLSRRVSARRAVALTALITAFFHVPFALSGIHHIEGMSIARVVFTMSLGHIAAGLVLGWLWMRTESVWMVALAHGSLNNWGQYAFKYMDFGQADPATVLGAGSLALFVVGAALITFAMPPGEPGLRPRNPAGSRAVAQFAP